jgi:HSP20 family protein
MALVRWEPTRELDTLQTEVNRVFDAFFGNGTGARTRRWMPAMDLVETDEHLVLRADLPGLDHDDVNVEVKDGTLTVSGERKAEHAEKSEGFYRVERAYGSFARSLSLPRGVDADRIDADFDRGVLEVRIPKPAESKPHRVAIRDGEVEGAGAEK